MIRWGNGDCACIVEADHRFELIAGLGMGGEVHMMEVRDVPLQLQCTDGVKGIVR